MRSSFRFVVLVVLTGATLSAGAATAGHKPRHAYTKTDLRLADDIVMHPGDFPTGWRVETESSKSNAGSKCCTPNFSDLILTGKAASKTYVNGDVTRAASAAAVFKTHAMAIAAFDRIDSGKLAACFSSYVKGHSSGGTKVKDVTWGRLTFPHLGDRSRAIEIAIEIRRTA